MLCRIIIQLFGIYLHVNWYLAAVLNAELILITFTYIIVNYTKQLTNWNWDSVVLNYLLGICIQLCCIDMWLYWIDIQLCYIDIQLYWIYIQLWWLNIQISYIDIMLGLIDILSCWINFQLHLYYGGLNWYSAMLNGT